MEDKIKVIDEIVKRHPSVGTDRGWSWYVGGMRDTGDWYYRKMLDVPIEELRAFLAGIIAQETAPPPVFTEQELIDQKTFLPFGNGLISKYQKEQWEKFSREREHKLLFGEKPSCE